VVAGKIERNKADLCSTVFRFDADDVLVLGRAGTEFQMIRVRIDVNGVSVMVLVLAAGESRGGASGLPDGVFSFAFKDVTVPGHVPAVKRLDFVGGVGGLEGGGFYTEVKVTEVEVDVGGVFVFSVVLFDRDCAGLGGETDPGNVGVVVRLDVH